MLRIDERQLRVMKIMTAIRQGSDQCIMLQLRRNGLALKSKRSLQLTVRSLCEIGVLRHDHEARVYVVVDDAAEAWYVRIEKLHEEHARLIRDGQDQLAFKGSRLYSWTKIAKVKVRHG